MRDVVKTPGGPVQGALSGMSVQRDPVMETPRRVMFGAPMAAEFNHLSPSNRLTPMPSRAAKVGKSGWMLRFGDNTLLYCDLEGGGGESSLEGDRLDPNHMRCGQYFVFPAEVYSLLR